LYQELKEVDPVAAERISPKDAKRIIRALEVYRLTSKPISSLQKQWNRKQKIEDGRQKRDEELNSSYLAPQFIGGFSLPTKQDWKIIGLRREKSEENKRINLRVKKMIADGLVDEVKSLLAEEKPLSLQARSAIGYTEIINYLNGQISLEDTVERIKINTRRLAKHQRTWFRTFRNVNWIDIAPENTAEKIFDRAKAILNHLE
jgi:tRNA dimethylallyltransferase